MDNDKDESSEGNNNNGDSSLLSSKKSKVFHHSSGGYADTIYCYAAKELFGYDTDPTQPLPWKPVSGMQQQNQKSKVVSARVAALQKRQPPSIAISSTESSIYEKDGTVTTKIHNAAAPLPSSIPLISSSCPALVC